jgi:hypothetical protein
MTEKDKDFAGVNCSIHKIKLLSGYLLRGIGAIVAASILVCVSLCALLIVAAVPYHYDAQQLDRFYKKQMAVDQRLWTLRVCVEMNRHPERWQDTSVTRLPCADAEAQDQEALVQYQEEHDSWSRLIADREADWRQRESGRFGFLAKKMYHPDASPFEAVPDRLWLDLKWSQIAEMVVLESLPLRQNFSLQWVASTRNEWKEPSQNTPRCRDEGYALVTAQNAAAAAERGRQRGRG